MRKGLYAHLVRGRIIQELGKIVAEYTVDGRRFVTMVFSDREQSGIPLSKVKIIVS